MSSESGSPKSRADLSAGFIRSGRGSSAIEFAMVFPLLVMLMFAIIVVGQAIYMAATAQWAIERGVRELMISSQASGSALARDLEETVRRLSGLEVSVNYEEDGSGPLPVARMSTSVSIPIIVPFLPTYQFNYIVESHVPRPFQS